MTWASGSCDACADLRISSWLGGASKGVLATAAAACALRPSLSPVLAPLSSAAPSGFDARGSSA
eukprot:CAMPEP_0179258846 /NCGR_PEP_ID=MMETSP0797-20121207/25523_1 /TAXON_ID=47934 /ORGANISM="Dinophysis acuminata, Strain DAEP01" /LENGTH=63 /DNA_ID=CAMNT_0020966885 /DNA_START=252 /DNA_END=439 /DNA_ORIENTATION=+